MATDPKKGDAAAWRSSQGTVTGKVERELTTATDIEGHHVAASQDNPEYLVKSDRTGAEAAHRPGSLQKR